MRLSCMKFSHHAAAISQNYIYLSSFLNEFVMDLGKAVRTYSATAAHNWDYYKTGNKATI